MYKIKIRVKNLKIYFKQNYKKTNLEKEATHPDTRVLHTPSTQD